MPEEAAIQKIDFNKSEQYILSIRLSTDGFSFSVYNPIRDSFILSQRWEIKPELSFTANLKLAYKTIEFLSYTYKQVQVVLVSPRFTLIPDELFDPQQLESFFYYNYKPKENEVVLKNNLTKSGAVVLFALDKSVYHFLCEQYDHIAFYSSVSALAEHFAVRSRLGTSKKMYVCLHPDFVVLYVYESGHLMLLNPYMCHDNSDRIYYLLYVWKQMIMDQQCDELHIVGGSDLSNDEQLEFTEGVQRFVQHVLVDSQKVNPIISNISCV